MPILKLPTVIYIGFISLLAAQVSAFTYGLLLPEYLYNHRNNLPISLGGVIEHFVEPVGLTVAGYHNSNVTHAGMNIVAVTATTLTGVPVKSFELDTSYNLTLTSSPNGTVNLNINLDGALIWGQDLRGMKVGKFLSFPQVFSYFPYALDKQGIVHNQVLSNTSQVTSIIYHTPKDLHGKSIRIGGLAVTDNQFGTWGFNFTIHGSTSGHRNKHLRPNDHHN